jgi:hypothetical protein
MGVNIALLKSQRHSPERLGMKNLICLILMCFTLGCQTLKNVTQLRENPNDPKWKHNGRSLEKWVAGDLEVQNMFAACDKLVNNEEAYFKCSDEVSDILLARMRLRYKYANENFVLNMIKAYPKQKETIFEELDGVVEITEYAKKYMRFQFVLEKYMKQSHEALVNQQNAQSSTASWAAFGSALNQYNTQNQISDIKAEQRNLRIQNCQQQNRMNAGINTPCN